LDFYLGVEKWWDWELTVENGGLVNSKRYWIFFVPIGNNCDIYWDYYEVCV